MQIFLKQILSKEIILVIFKFAQHGQIVGVALALDKSTITPAIPSSFPGLIGCLLIYAGNAGSQ